MKPVTKAVIPAAGLGTRVLPATKAMPKGMLPIVDKPAIQYLVEEAVRSGVTDILIILGRNQSIMQVSSDVRLFKTVQGYLSLNTGPLDGKGKRPPQGIR